MNKLDLYSTAQFFDTYLNFENVQRPKKAYNPFINNLNPQNIKPNKYNSLSLPCEVVPPFDNHSKGIPHMDYLPLEYPPYYAPFETGTNTFNHRLFFNQ
jgi:hypothetical protein